MAAITQEDLLCDGCRAEHCVRLQIEDGRTAPWHVVIKGGLGGLALGRVGVDTETSRLVD